MELQQGYLKQGHVLVFVVVFCIRVWAERKTGLPVIVTSYRQKNQDVGQRAAAYLPGRLWLIFGSRGQCLCVELFAVCL